MAHDVFLSYSSKDKTVADAACATLESHAIRCWIAPRDIVPGSDWGGAIVDAIQGARLMVLIFSSNANESQQIKREVERAVAKGIPIIPFRIEDVLPSRNLEYFLSTPHWLDALSPPLERHLEYLSSTIRLLLDGADDAARSALKAPPSAAGAKAALPLTSTPLR
ncbi:MAG TPA: toll/interleukin-1 receptor domain-containing protein, partial [Dehalococcoidia bacterium]